VTGVRSQCSVDFQLVPDVLSSLSVLNITEQGKYMDRFPREIHEAIGWYVYRLIDPRTGHTFYVGKGRGDRVFEHVKGALNEDEAEDDAIIDLKTETIRDIQRQGEQVLHVIHRHGIETAEQAYLVEAALMDAYPGITNIAGGHASAEYGCRTAQQMVGTYSAEELKACEPLILIFIGRALEEGRSVYDAVRAAWRMSLQNAQNYKLVLAYDISGLVVGAFRPIRWLPAIRENFHFLQTDEPRRIGFDGVRATEVESQKPTAHYPALAEAITPSANALAMKALEDDYVKVFHGVKTFEYDFALHEKNRAAMIAALKDIHPQIGIALVRTVDALWYGLNQIRWERLRNQVF
jgi:hypothetical protein